jgi:FHS family L-fucose permease-like MFS transporter
MIGRFLGGSLLRGKPAGRVLIGATSIALCLLLLSANIPGEAAGWALLAIGLCNSVMYPTIFALASSGLGEHVAEGSGVIVLASVGGGIVPVLTGLSADHLGLKLALGVPALCYSIILAYGVYVQRCARSGRHGQPDGDRRSPG